MNDDKKLDVICLGRAAVDLYGEQIGSRLEDMSSFSKYLGGSSCNIAYGTARLGLKSSMLTRVGDEHMGRFVKEELARGGVDVSHVVTDPKRLTGLVILGIKDQDTFPLIFYRNDCADMALSESDIDQDYIASSRALLVTGTHLSTETTYASSKKAMEYAKQANAKVILDIDYRPVLWGLTGLGEGENRFVSSETVSDKLQTILPLCDLVVGTEEEIQIAGGSTNTITSLNKIRECTDATIVLKLGVLGCTVLDKNIPDREEDFKVFSGVTVDVLNVLGAGDAFISGFLLGWLHGEPYDICCKYANACGALVVSRHGCAPAIPSAKELDNYIQRSESVARPDKDERLKQLHRVTTRRSSNWNNLCILAFDHRKQFYDMVIKQEADPDQIPILKSLLLKAVNTVSEQADLHGRLGVLIDDTYGQPELNEATGKGWWIGRPVEEPASCPLELEGGRDISARLQIWPSEHIVKCLVFYHPDDEITLRLMQERQIKELYRACMNSGHELLLELIPPAGSKIDDRTILDTMTRFYNLDIYPDWWKLPPNKPEVWSQITDLITTRSPDCQGVLLLGLDAPIDELKKSFNQTINFPICKGFAVGRSIFGTPTLRWLANEINDQEFINAVVQNYLQLIEFWDNRTSEYV
jgi:5-dehydro-2-deoxygluconokinase